MRSKFERERERERGRGREGEGEGEGKGEGEGDGLAAILTSDPVLLIDQAWLHISCACLLAVLIAAIHALCVCLVRMYG